MTGSAEMNDPFDYKSIVEKLDSPHWDHTVDQIQQITKQLIALEKQLHDEIAAIEDPTIENVLMRYHEHISSNEFLENQVSFYLSVSTDKQLRDASIEAEKSLVKHSIEQSLRVDVFKVFKKLDEKVKADKDSDMDDETSRLLDKILLSFKKNGLDLPEDKRETFKSYKLKLSELSVEFAKNLNEQNEFLLFSEEELEGVPQDVISQFEVVEKDGKKQYKMTYKYPDVLPVLKYAKNQDTRKAAYNGNQAKCAVNANILEEMVQIRFNLAKLLGYDTFSNYVLDDRMSKNQANVMNLLNDLKHKLTPLGTKELQVLKQLKNEDLVSRGLPEQDEFYQWDMGYYNNLLLEQKYQVDHQKIQQYFPLDLTIEKMLSFYEKIFDIKFYKIDNPDPKTVWHEDVKKFAVFQNIKYGEPKPEFRGFIYFDLHPREGKYGHAANFGLGPGFEKPDGSRQTPLTVLVCNFTKKTKEKPSLLKHDEVTTFFHELGHGVHSILAETKYSKFHGTKVPRDFVEAPSQMLEFWTWTKNELKTLSNHYETGESLGDELIDQLINSKKVNNGLQYLRQLHFGFFDITLHTIDNEEGLKSLNMLETWNNLRNELTLMSTDGINTPGFASFGHIAQGYESGYYGYLYSQVFAVDIYYSLFKEDPMNVENGLKYRDTILSRGNSKEMMDNLKELLGREPNSDAFLEELLGE